MDLVVRISLIAVTLAAMSPATFAGGKADSGSSTAPDSKRHVMLFPETAGCDVCGDSAGSRGYAVMLSRGTPTADSRGIAKGGPTMRPQAANLSDRLNTDPILKSRSGQRTRGAAAYELKNALPQGWTPEPEKFPGQDWLKVDRGTITTPKAGNRSFAPDNF